MQPDPPEAVVLVWQSSSRYLGACLDAALVRGALGEGGRHAPWLLTRRSLVHIRGVPLQTHRPGPSLSPTSGCSLHPPWAALHPAPSGTPRPCLVGWGGWVNGEAAWPEAHVLGGLAIPQLGVGAGVPPRVRVSQGRTKLGPRPPSPSDGQERSPEPQAGEQLGRVPASKRGAEAQAPCCPWTPGHVGWLRVDV